MAAKPKTPPKDAPPIGSAEAGILLKANYRNLARKVQSGKTLSPGEVNLLEAIKGGNAPESKTYAADQSELAEALGVNRKTIQRWLKRDESPGTKPNGRYEIAAWRAFLQGKGSIAGEDESPESQTKLRARQLLLQNQMLEEKLAVLRRDYVPAVDVEKWGGELGAAIRKIVTQIHLAAPSVVGVSVPEAEARLKDAEDEILQQLHLIGEKLSAWKNEPSR